MPSSVGALDLVAQVAALRREVEALKRPGGPERVLRSGDKLTGRLFGPAGVDPIRPDEYARKAYVDGKLNGAFVLRSGDTMTGSLVINGADLIASGYGVFSNGMRIGEIYGDGGLHRSVAGPMKFSADTHIFVGRDNVYRSSLDWTGEWRARAFWAERPGGGGNSIQTHYHTEFDTAFIHFFTGYADETFHGNLFQDLVVRDGVNAQARMLMSTSELFGQWAPRIEMLSDSPSGTVKGSITLDANIPGGKIFLRSRFTEIDSATSILDFGADVQLRVGTDGFGNCRSVNSANTAWKPMEASAFTVRSDPKIKRAVSDATGDLTEQLRRAKVIRYRLSGDHDDGAEHLGVDATTLPALCQQRMSLDADGKPIKGYDVASALAWLAGVVQEIDQRLTTVEAR